MSFPRKRESIEIKTAILKFAVSEQAKKFRSEKQTV
jgi:hypothetical protein